MLACFSNFLLFRDSVSLKFCNFATVFFGARTFYLLNFSLEFAPQYENQERIYIQWSMRPTSADSSIVCRGSAKPE